MLPREAEEAGGFLSWWRTFWARPEGPKLPQEEEGEPPREEELVEVRPWTPAADYPKSLLEIVGHTRAVALLGAEVAACRRERRMPRPLLFVGPPGTGKSALAAAFANELGLLTFPTSGPEWIDQKAALTLMDAVTVAWERETHWGVMLVIDEADGMQRQASYPLHKFLTHGQVDYRGVALYRGLPCSFALTSNFISRVPPALRSRMAEVIVLDFLPPSELAEVGRRTAGRLELAITDEAPGWIGANSGGEPRKAIHIIHAAANLAEAGTITLEIAQKSLELSGLHRGGLSDTQLRILQYLAGREAASLSTLAAVCATAPQDLQQGEEMYLLRAGFLEITGRGRKITPAGREALG